MLAATHNSPQPLAESGHTFPTQCCTIYKVCFKLFTIHILVIALHNPPFHQHCSSTVTIGVAKDVPRDSFLLIYGILILTPGAVMSGFAYSRRPLFTLTPCQKMWPHSRSTPIGANTYCPPRSPRYCKCVLRRRP